MSELDNWKETALMYARNSNFYHGVVVQIGEAFGQEAYTSDDGSIQEDVLALKVPELVADLRKRLEIAERRLKIAMRGLDEYASQSNWACHDPNAEEPYDQMWTGDKGEHSFNGYELARRIKAEIEEVK